MAGDDLVAQLTSTMEGMEVSKIPSDILEREDSMKLESVNLLSSDVSSETARSSVNQVPPASKTMRQSRRPFDEIRDAGPPADPIDFPPPVVHRGRRDDVLCYNPRTREHNIARNVLFRNYSADAGDMDGGLSRVQRAYKAVPFKAPIKTIMGHVAICHVLERCPCEKDDSSEDGDSEGSDEEDIVFKLTTEYAAVKVNYCDRIEKLKNRHAEDPLQEISAMQLIGNDHPNVLGCMEVLFDGTNLNVVMPYCSSGDLFQLLQDTQGLNSHTPGLTEAQARFWFRQLMEGVRHLHSVGVCHRDLSPENVMIDGDGCLIIDMGMCLRVPYTDPKNPSAVTDITKGTQRRLLKPQGTCGKLPYMSPEIYRNRDAFDGGAIDVWTTGTILFCMLTGNRSYERPHSSDAQFYWMTHGIEQLIKDWAVPLSDEGLDLLKNLLQIDPRNRLTIEEVLSHPWFSYADEAINLESIMSA